MARYNLAVKRNSERRKASRAGRLTLQAGLLTIVALFGCNREPSVEIAIAPASFEVRASRRAFDGAPPVIPHVSFGVACVTCHTETGRATPTVGQAPANPHFGDRRTGALTNCRQCHLFAQTGDQFVANGFQGVHQILVRGERATSNAPPVIPHDVQMRANCQACHGGAAARPEIVCTHLERTNCVQCHLQARTASVFSVKE